MNKVLVCKLPVNYRSRESLLAKVQEIDAIIDELMNQALKSVQQGNIAEYELDTGQTRVRRKYETIGSVRRAIEDYESLRQMYVNKLNRSTGSFRLMDESNFKRRRG